MDRKHLNWKFGTAAVPTTTVKAKKWTVSAQQSMQKNYIENMMHFSVVDRVDIFLSPQNCFSLLLYSFSYNSVSQVYSPA